MEGIAVINFPDFESVLAQIIDAGKTSANESYGGKPEKEQHLRGAMDGFEACRGKDSDGLLALLKKAYRSANDSVMKQEADVWYWKARYAEIEWTCNVMSAVLDANRLPVIIHPTVRGVRAAQHILNL